MKWQEYQEAVGRLFEQMSEFGKVEKNITIPDRVTGQPRQIDVWWEIKLDTHIIKILIDAKKRKETIDVKDVEEIIMLANAVKADKAIIVTNEKWTKPAELKAKFEGLDLRVLTIDEATELVVEDKWMMCQICKVDCVVLDLDGYFSIQGLVNWFLGGKCRNCDSVYINCQSCGDKGIINTETNFICYCPFNWKLIEGKIEVYKHDPNEYTNFENPNQLKINF
jgi:Restriction endonuclease